MNRIETIKKELKVNISNVYKFKETKKEVLDFYLSNIDKINSLKQSTFDNYSFLSEVLQKCERKEKRSFTDKIYKKVIKLERHAYAPEMNKLHFKKDIFIKVPKCTNIESAVLHCIKTLSINQLKNL